MSRVFAKDVIVEGEKKMVKVVDDDKPCNFCLISNYLKVKDFNSGYDQNGVGYNYDLTSVFKDGFIIEKYSNGLIHGTQAYNYDFDLLASINAPFKINITDNQSFRQFVKEFNAEENCK